MSRPIFFATLSAGFLLLGVSGSVTAQGKSLPGKVAGRPSIPLPEDLKRAFPGDSLRTLKGATTFILYSIRPGARMGRVGVDGTVEKIEAFHNHDVLAKATLNISEKNRVLDSFYDALVYQEEMRRKNPHSVSVGVSCFSPRHGIRAVQEKTGKRVDILICFSCGNSLLFRGMDGADEQKDVSTHFKAFGKASYDYFNELFQKHSLPLDP